MLTDRADRPFHLVEQEPVDDRMMLVLQYLVAFVAMAAAALLALIR